jgi:hypothetical protein
MWITNVDLSLEEAEGENRGFRRASVQKDEERSLSPEVGKEKREKTIDDESLE